MCSNFCHSSMYQCINKELLNEFKLIIFMFENEYFLYTVMKLIVSCLAHCLLYSGNLFIKETKTVFFCYFCLVNWPFNIICKLFNNMRFVRKSSRKFDQTLDHFWKLMTYQVYLFFFCLVKCRRSSMEQAQPKSWYKSFIFCTYSHKIGRLS